MDLYIKDVFLIIKPNYIFNHIILYRFLSNIFKSYPNELIILINKWFLRIYITKEIEICGNNLCHRYLFKNLQPFPCSKCKKVYLCEKCAYTMIYKCAYCGSIIDYL